MQNFFLSNFSIKITLVEFETFLSANSSEIKSVYLKMTKTMVGQPYLIQKYRPALDSKSCIIRASTTRTVVYMHSVVRPSTFFCNKCSLAKSQCLSLQKLYNCESKSKYKNYLSEFEIKLIYYYFSDLVHCVRIVENLFQGIFTSNVFNLFIIFFKQCKHNSNVGETCGLFLSIFLIDIILL